MSRIGTSSEIVVKPRNNVYTALAGAATIAVALGLIALFMRATALGISFK